MRIVRERHAWISNDIVATPQLAPAIRELAKDHDFIPRGLIIEIAPGHAPRQITPFVPRGQPPPELAARYEQAVRNTVVSRR